MKRSAFITIWGIVVIFTCSVVSGAGWMYEASQQASYFGSDGGGAAVGLIFGLGSIVGLVLVCVGVYRALSKLDALPLPAPVREYGQP